MSKTIYLGADHAGFALKEKLKGWLEQHKVSYKDLGAHTLDPGDDYPLYAAKVGKWVVKNNSKGILVCGSAQGMCMAANKVRGIRAAVPFSLKEAQLAREHEDANVLCLSGWFFSYAKAVRMLDVFLKTRFSGARRHRRRLREIRAMEGKR